MVCVRCTSGRAWRRSGTIGWQVRGSEDAVAFRELWLVDGRGPQMVEAQGRCFGTPRLGEALGGQLVADRRGGRWVFMAGGGLRRI